VTVINTTTQYAQCNITVLAVRMQDTEFYSYFVPIFDRTSDGQTDGQTDSWSGGTRGYLPVLYIIIIIVKINYFKKIYNINPMYVAVGWHVGSTSTHVIALGGVQSAKLM
jgi:hypothetical protein